MLTDSIKSQIEKELSVLVGTRIRQIRRAALMIGISFGDDIEHTYATGPRQGEVELLPKYVMHIHSSWRLIKNDDICLAQSEMFNRIIDGCFKIYKYEDEVAIDSVPFIEISKELNKAFETKVIRVTKVEANELGDLRIHMEEGYYLELFVDSVGNIESWRFFSNESETHFVIFDEAEDT